MTKEEALQRFLDCIHEIQWLDREGLSYSPRWRAAMAAADEALQSYRAAGATQDDVIALGLGAHKWVRR